MNKSHINFTNNYRNNKFSSRRSEADRSGVIQRSGSSCCVLSLWVAVLLVSVSVLSQSSYAAGPLKRQALRTTRLRPALEVISTKAPTWSDYFQLGPKTRLFPNNSMENWTRSDGKEPGSGWKLEDGVLTRASQAGDLISKNEYEFFILEFDWAIKEHVNSGVKYRLKKYGNSWLGCEYQLLDDAAPSSGETNPKNHTGSLYDVYAPTEEKHLKPIGEFNHTKISVFGNKIEHWLNGELILTVLTGTDDWKAHIEKSKFNEAEGFGENSLGRLMIQDHGGEISIKNMTIQEYIRIR